MNSDALYEDPKNIENAYHPDLHQITLSSAGEKMFGVMFTAQGEGPHPTMLLLHGFPGNESNFDLAHALRRTGWNVFIFHYRGTWGSKGEFTFSNMLEDIRAAAAFIQTEATAAKYRIDIRNIFVGGNSVGGFAALLSTSWGIGVRGCVSISSYDLGLLGETIPRDEKVMTALRDMLTECVEPVNGSSVEELIEEIITHSTAWNLLNHAGELAKYPVLMIAGSRDDVGPPDLHFHPLINALKAQGSERLVYHLLESDHGFQDQRVRLSRIIAGWLEKLLLES